MGVIEFFVFVVVVAALGSLTVFLLGKVAPGHPPHLDTIVWIVVVLIILIVLVRALGLASYDPQIPHLR